MLCRSVKQGDRVADLGGLQFLDPGDDVTNLARTQDVANGVNVICRAVTLMFMLSPARARPVTC